MIKETYMPTPVKDTEGNVVEKGKIYRLYSFSSWSDVTHSSPPLTGKLLVHGDSIMIAENIFPNSITLKIIASIHDIYFSRFEWVLQFHRTLIHVPQTELPLWIGYKYKTPLFDALLKGEPYVAGDKWITHADGPKY
jgi:hypothetical protein